VEGPPRRLNAWQGLPWWDTYVALVAAVVAAFVLVGEHHRPFPYRVASAALIGGFVAWYAVSGRRLVGRESTDRPVWIFVIVAAVLVAAATGLASGASFVLFAFVPVVFSIMPIVPAVAVVVVLNLVPSVVYLGRTGDLAGTIAGPFPVAVLVTVFAVAFAVWITRIVEQSSERAELIDELAASRAEVARLSHEAGTAAERQRLAGEIHDTIAQGLSSVVMLVQAVEADLDRDAGRARHHLAMAGRAARESLAEARALVAGMSPAQLTDSSLADVLRRLAERFREETGVPVTTAVAVPAEPLPTAVEVVLLRSAQEALANVRKHANATAVDLTLECRPGSAVLTVTDNGAGIATGGPPGFGLAAMRTRVTDVGGTLRIEAPEDGGTRLTVAVPA
jgi:signal transduction histidine kinase